MLYLLDKDVRTVRWNGEPLHEATSAIVKETSNGEFLLTVKYPISDTGIYQQIKEDMLIKCPTPVLGPQLFRIKKPVENNDHLEITAYHITDDIMQRSIKPVSVDNQSCGMALSRMVQNAKTDLGEFSFNSDIQDRRSFNTTETSNLYSVLLDGKHSIVGTWEGELVRDNFSLTIKKNRGENRGVVITTHKNLKSYQRSKNSQNVITRIHAKSTYKPEGSEDEVTINVTVDSPLINQYPYINEKEYENNNAKSVEELRKWAQAKFTNEGIDKVSDAIKIEAYELDGQIVNLGDTVNIKSLKHNADLFKKAIAYEYDGLKEEYISLTFDDKAEAGGSKSFGGLSNAAETILNVTQSAQEIALDKAIKNADLDFEYQSNKLRQEIQDGIELAKAKAEENKRALSNEIDRRFQEFSPTGFEEAKAKAEEALRKAGAIPELQDRFENLDREQSEQGLKLYRMTNDFQSVKETAQLYERILGDTDNGIADNVARMAMTSQLFQVEVAKNVGDSRNFVRNANFRDGSKNWTLKSSNGFNFNFDHSIKYRKKTGVHIFGQVANSDSGLEQKINLIVKSGGKITLSLLISKDGGPTFSGLRIGLQLRNNNSDISHLWKDVANSEIPWEKYKRLDFTFEVGSDIDEVILKLYGEQDKTINLYISEIKLETGSQATSFTLAPEDTEEAVKTVQTQLADSWAVKTLNGAGDIVSQINLNNNNALIEANKIRLKGKTLADEITAIDGYFKRLFVGDAKVGTLNADIIQTNSITADKLVMDLAMARRFVSSDIFTDTLAAKEAFINKLRSVVVSATLLEGYKGRIGGFQIGTHDKDPNSYWLTGQNQFKVGMGSGNGRWGQTALWVNWGNNWEKPGDAAWYVKNNGEMYCYNQAHFWNTPIIHGNLKVSGNIYYITDQNTGIGGYWIHSPSYKRIEEKAGYAYLYRFDDSYSWFTLNKDISDRRYKSNIQDSQVSALDIIESLKTYSYRKEYDDKVEDISCGIMAQDVQQYAPEAFFENPDGAYSYNTFALVPYLIKAIQELNQKVERLEKTT